MDDDTAAILKLVAGDPVHDRDRTAIVTAIIHDGLDHGGNIDPNRVRRQLAHVYPRLIGATYSAMRAAGIIEPDGWTVNDDRRGGNTGKPARTYRLIFPSNEIPAADVRMYRRRITPGKNTRPVRAHGSVPTGAAIARVLVVGFQVRSTTAAHKNALKAELNERVAGADHIEIRHRDSDPATVAWIVAELKTLTGHDRITVTHDQQP